MVIRRGFWKEDHALSTFGRLLVLYFAFGAGIVYSGTTYCDVKTAANNSQGGCDLSVTGINSSEVTRVANNTHLPQRIETGNGILNVIANAAAWALTAVIGFLQTAMSVVGWPGLVISSIPGFPPMLGSFVSYGLTFLIVIAGIMWWRGLQ